MKTYRGYYSEIGPCQVEVDGEPLDPRLDLYPHSPDGFQWSFGGSGPAQLALAILADCLGDDVALKWYQQFKWGVVANLPKDDWTLSEGRVRRLVGFLEHDEQPWPAMYDFDG